MGTGLIAIVAGLVAHTLVETLGMGPVSPFDPAVPSHDCMLCIYRMTLCVQRGYDGELLGGTFSRAVFVGNGLIAIVAGLIAHTLVETLGMGPVIPFDTAALVMICGGVIVLFTWTENFGNSSEKTNFLDQLKNGAHAIANGESLQSTMHALLMLPRIREIIVLWTRGQALLGTSARKSSC